jgi:hypothetical protein
MRLAKTEPKAQIRKVLLDSCSGFFQERACWIQFKRRLDCLRASYYSQRRENQLMLRSGFEKGIEFRRAAELCKSGFLL